MKKHNFYTELAYFLGIAVLALGTIVCALVNGWLIGWCTYVLDQKFEFTDRFAARKYFEK